MCLLIWGLMVEQLTPKSLFIPHIGMRAYKFKVLVSQVP